MKTGRFQLYDNNTKFHKICSIVSKAITVDNDGYTEIMAAISLYFSGKSCSKRSCENGISLNSPRTQNKKRKINDDDDDLSLLCYILNMFFIYLGF